MAARAIGSGTISFGLVSIPVKLYSTVDSTKAIRFNYLTEDGSRVKQQYVTASSGEVVERSELMQGYEFAKGQYVMFTQEEVKAMNIESTNAIDIAEFVPLAEIERIYIDKVYYMGPDKGASRSYHLLKEALASTERAALASYATRGKSHLVLIRPMGDGLVMEQLKHQDELRTFEDVPIEEASIEADELDLAIKIIEQRVNEAFEPEQYEDVVRSKMTELIQQKIDGQEIKIPQEAAPEAKIVDLMEALKASVGSKTKKKSAASGSKRKTAARAGRKAGATKAQSASGRKTK
ncbi:MAG: Ku protein [Pseudomonadales bacterium]|nr:Ku protein [Pseudomonadales bacterium]